MADFPRSILEFQHQFPDEAACAAWLAAARWPQGFRCPGCGHGHAWELAAKAWTRECAKCRRQTSVKAGTAMHGSKLPLTVWFWAAYLMATHSNGISARQLWRQLGLGSCKSAWLLCAKLRRAMVNPARALLSGLVEIDETQIPYRTKDDPVAGGRDPAGKMQVIGNMAAHIVLPWVHRVFSNPKTWALGVYHGPRRHHLQSYLDEFVFRFNRRRTPHAAFRTLLGIGVAIKPATYNMLIAAED